MPHATIEFHDWGALTRFADGAELPAAPQDDHAYLARAKELGYGSDVLAMCQHHELLHSVTAELMNGGPSPALWRVAHGDHSKRGLGVEEDLVLRVQRAMRGSGYPDGRDSRGKYMTDRAHVWIAGRFHAVTPEGYRDDTIDPRAWDFAGVFSTKEKAVAACRDSSYFVGPARMDAELPHEAVEWQGAFLPHEVRQG